MQGNQIDPDSNSETWQVILMLQYNSASRRLLLRLLSRRQPTSHETGNEKKGKEDPAIRRSVRAFIFLVHSILLGHEPPVWEVPAVLQDGL